MAKIVAIHQPNFFPWLGYFDKIARSDIFIFLDHVQFPKTGGIWTNRVKLLVGGEARWVTAPVVRNFHGVRTIADMEFQPDGRWREKFIKNLRANYTKAPFYSDVIAFLEPLILNPELNISRYNRNAIIAISSRLGITDGKFCLSSALDIKETSNELLISLARTVDCDTYLCGGGAQGYQNDALFFASGIIPMHQNYGPPIYPQAGSTEHISGLSIIDALMNCGFSQVTKLLNVANTLPQNI